MEDWLGYGVEVKVEGELPKHPIYQKGTYTITTPVNPKRTWNLPMYIRGIKRLNPAPKAVGIVTTREVFDEFFSGDPLFVFVAEHPDMELYMLDRIGMAREALRIWFLKERKEEYQWWLDSDIEVFEDTAKLIMEELEKSNVLMFSNGVEGRGWGGGKGCTGIGCTMVHRDIADVGRFFVARAVGKDGERAYICEDYMYFTAFMGAERILLHRFFPDKKGIRKAQREGFPTVHYLWDNREDFVPKHYDLLKEVLRKEEESGS